MLQESEHLSLPAGVPWWRKRQLPRSVDTKRGLAGGDPWGPVRTGEEGEVKALGPSRPYGLAWSYSPLTSELWLE